MQEPPRTAWHRSRLSVVDSRQNGYVEGETIFVEYRWGGGQYDQLPRLASELIRRPVVLLVTGAEPAALAAKAVTSSIPIVFSVGTDPVKLGLVRSFNQPGGNATGMYILTTSLGTKRLGLLHEVMPRVEIIGVLSNPSFPAAQAQMGELQAAAEALGLRVRMFSASSIQEIDAAFQVIPSEHVTHS